MASGTRDWPPARFEGVRAPVAVGLLTAVAVPFAELPVGHHPSFLPALYAMLIGCELATAAVLAARYRSHPRPLTLVLALAFACSSLLALLHVVAMPRMVTPSGVWASLPQLCA